MSSTLDAARLRNISVAQEAGLRCGLEEVAKPNEFGDGSLSLSVRCAICRSEAPVILIDFPVKTCRTYVSISEKRYNEQEEMRFFDQNNKKIVHTPTTVSARSIAHHASGITSLPLQASLQQCLHAVPV